MCSGPDINGMLSLITDHVQGWGVRSIAFVDNGVVSFSNPVRQSLFTYDDAVNRVPKAQAAAEACVRIFPGMVSQAPLRLMTTAYDTSHADYTHAWPRDSG